MSAEFAIGLIGAHHHGERIPAHDCGETLFDGDIPGVGRLCVERDGVAVRRERLNMGDDAQALRTLLESLEQEQTAIAAGLANGGLE